MSFGLLWKNKNKPGSEALPAKMTVLGHLLGRLVCSQLGGPLAVGEAGEAPGGQVLVAPLRQVIFLQVSENLVLLWSDVMGTFFPGSPGNTQK